MKFIDTIQKSDFISINKTDDNFFCVGTNGVTEILRSKDKKLNLVCFENGECLACVVSAFDFTAYYPIKHVCLNKDIKAVLMDLDGTSVHSENFWIEIIRLTTARLLECREFSFEEADLPFVSGHSVSEHLSYCINKYCPRKELNEAVRTYFDITHEKMNAILGGKSDGGEFTPAPCLKEFLLFLKERGIKIGLVTSGLYEKAYPEILSVCKELGMGTPESFYDSIITAGNPLNPNSCGTLGEISAKPHPWLYLETALIGLGINPGEKDKILGIEDSGAGVCSLRLAGIPTIGVKDGNIEKSGLSSLCLGIYDDLDVVRKIYFEGK